MLSFDLPSNIDFRSFVADKQTLEPFVAQDWSMKTYGNMVRFDPAKFAQDFVMAATRRQSQWDKSLTDLDIAACWHRREALIAAAARRWFTPDEFRLFLNSTSVSQLTAGRGGIEELTAEYVRLFSEKNRTSYVPSVAEATEIVKEFFQRHWCLFEYANLAKASRNFPLANAAICLILAEINNSEGGEFRIELLKADGNRISGHDLIKISLKLREVVFPLPIIKPSILAMLIANGMELGKRDGAESDYPEEQEEAVIKAIEIANERLSDVSRIFWGANIERLWSALSFLETDQRDAARSAVKSLMGLE